MNISRHGMAGMFLMLIMLVGLSACGTATQPLDALTHAEPDATRQRAMRRLHLASAYFEQGQNEVAQQEVRAALQIDAHYAEAYSLLGLIHQRALVPTLAQQSFEKAVQLASQPPVHAAELGAIQHNYGWFLCEQRRFSDAHAQFTQALAQPGYRQADKTYKAIDICRQRDKANSHLQRSNN